MIIDFETRSSLDLSVVGAYRYADPRFTTPICMSWKMWTGSSGTWWPNYPMPELVQAAIRCKEPFAAHNSEFDELIWERVLGWPAVDWVDTMALAAYNGFPLGLDQIAISLGIESKDKAGRKAMLKMSKPPYPDTPELRSLTGRYCVHDVEITEALIRHCESLPPELRDLYKAHRAVNSTGIAVDVASVQLIQNVLTDYISSRVHPVEEVLGFRLSQVPVLLAWLNSRGACLENLQSDNLERWLTDNTGTVGTFTREVVQARLLAGLASVKKYTSLENQVSDAGRLRGQYQFLTCRSGRMSSKGVQVHNLLRAKVDDKFFDLLPDGLEAIERELGNPFEQCSKALRQCFVAGEGNELTIGDYAQIELRVILWLVGEYGQLDRLADGEDLYIELARDIFENPDLTKKANDFERQVGKKGKLGCGYGIGPEAFQNMCAKEGIVISRELACRTVAIYRTSMKRVTVFWDCVEECYDEAFKHPQEKIALEMVEGGPKIEFMFDGSHLRVFLPSGRRLIYREAELGPDGLSYMGVHPKTHQWVRLRIWGSAMTGHIVQGIAACLLHSAMVRLNACMPSLELHTHDECGVEAPIGLIDLQTFGAIMGEAPEWTKTRAKDLPIKVDVNQCKRYAKG